MSASSIKKVNTGIMFNLKADSGQVIATAEVCTTAASCETSIESVRRNAPIAALEDQTVEGFAAAKCPKFEMYVDNAGEFRFRLKATNGEIIAASEGCAAKESCENGIASVRENAPVAEMVEE